MGSQDDNLVKNVGDQIRGKFGGGKSPQYLKVLHLSY